MIDGKSTVCVTLENIGKLLCSIYLLDLFIYWFSGEMEMFMLNFDWEGCWLLPREVLDVMDIA